MVVREKLRTTTAAVRGRAYDVVTHQQAAMPEQLLSPPAADSEHDDQEPEPGRQGVVDLTAMRAQVSVAVTVDVQQSAARAELVVGDGRQRTVPQSPSQIAPEAVPATFAGGHTHVVGLRR